MSKTINEIFDVRVITPRHGDKVMIYISEEEEQEATYFEYLSGICSCFIVNGKPNFKSHLWKYINKDD